VQFTFCNGGKEWHVNKYVNESNEYQYFEMLIHSYLLFDILHPYFEFQYCID